jgi:hypothetical protein
MHIHHTNLKDGRILHVQEKSMREDAQIIVSLGLNQNVAGLAIEIHKTEQQMLCQR